MNCFDCGCQIELTGRVGFREVCPECGRSLHICLNCSFYDPTFNNQCREPQAERVVDKDRANFCEYFSIRKASKPQRLSPANDARAKLEALFKKKL
jgi:hypothetical protein